MMTLLAHFLATAIVALRWRCECVHENEGFLGHLIEQP